MTFEFNGLLSEENAQLREVSSSDRKDIIFSRSNAYLRGIFSLDVSFV